MRLLIIFLSFLLINNIIAQNMPEDSLSIDAVDQGDVRFLVDVDNGYFEIVIDDTMYRKIYRTTLEVGHHKAKVWSPGYVSTIVEFDIKKNQVTDTYVKMAISNNRQEFEREYKAYRMQFHKSLTVPLSITLATALTSGAIMMSAYSLKQKIFEDIDLYFAAPTYEETIFYKDRIALNNTKYNRRRIIFYSGLGLTAAAVGTTIFTYTRFKKNTDEPRLISPSPFKDKFSWFVSPFGCSFKWRLG
jgi:hypothetical protein